MSSCETLQHHFLRTSYVSEACETLRSAGRRRACHCTRCFTTRDIARQNIPVCARGRHVDLIEYDSKTFKPRGSLAAEWKQINPTQLRLTLRPGVKFSDGSDFSAVDAKFSLERAKAKSSNFRVYALGVDDSAQ